MTIHFSQFDDLPPALDDLVTNPAEKARLEALKELTGCTLVRVIDGVCQDPECPNYGQRVNKPPPAGERLPQTPAAAASAASEAGERPPAGAGDPKDALTSGIFHTENRLRCVL